MKATAILTATLGLALGSLHAQTVPLFINYQGKVTDSTGVGLGDAAPVNRKVIFRIFDAASAGTRLWSEQHTVTISKGEFSVLLGNGINANYAGADETPLKTVTPLDTVFTSAGILRYVEIVVDNGDNTLNGTDAPIAPRQQITSTAYSFRARSADTITNGTDLQLNNSADYGLGWYGSTKLFNGTSVNGPVLYGQAGGALGSVNGSTKNIALRWNAAGAVGIGSTDLSGAAATTKLVLQGDDANAAPLQLNIRGNTDINKRLLLGYNTTGNYGSLQAYSAASTVSNLSLNPVGGKVGIGTTTPNGALDVEGYVRIASGAEDRGLLCFGNRGAGAGYYDNGIYRGELGNTGSGNYLNLGSYAGIAFNTSTAALGAQPTRMFIDGVSGNVGIGTSTPTQAKLMVVGSATDSIGPHYAYDTVGPVNASTFSGPIVGVSIKASDAIHAGLFRAVSDARIKVIEGASDREKDLEMLSRIEITDYTHKDVIGKGKAKQKKVIAQQVETVFPQAVEKTTDVVPDIYKMAKIADGWVELETDLKVGERVRLIGDKEEGIYEVLEVKKDKFRTKYEPPTGKAFVFGREVKDFRVVDYEAIAMLNVSATQELARQLEQQKAENAGLKERLAELEKSDKARDAKMAAIEKLLESPDQPATRTVSLKQGE